MTEGRPYWRDVGTLDAYWEANMELTKVVPDLNLYDKQWPIWTYQEQLPPAKFVFDDGGRRGTALDSLVSGGCVISGATVRRSLLFSSVHAHSFAQVEDSVVLPNVDIGRNVVLRRCVVEKNCRLPPGLQIGVHPEQDRKYFDVSPKGVTLVDARDAGRAGREAKSRALTGAAGAAPFFSTPLSKDRTMNTPAAAVPGVDLLLMWHMHQPDYRDQSTGEFAMPWVYLHALKDYSDMAWHLEQHPDMRAVVNFVPVLLDQLEDYCAQFAQGTLRDPLLRLLARSEDTALTEEERSQAFDQCFRANHHRLIAPFAPYKRLFDLFHAMEAQGRESLTYLSDRYVYDLVTWYHLSWTGESVRRESEVVSRLMVKGAQFDEDDRVALLQVVAEQVAAVVPRYRALAERGQVELTSTPHCHPLSPLMLDFACARDALPDAPLPQSPGYPGGEARVLAHLDSALRSHATRFGAPPAGMWPAEGALSARFAAMLAARGLAWTASSQGVLANSLRASGVDGADAEHGIALAHRPYRASTVAPGLLFFFRDDRLSDLIGFSYSKWHGRDAANNLVHELEAIARAAQHYRPLVSVILDGENAWEYYPYNGYFFLSDLYRGLSGNAVIRTVTGSDIVAEQASAAPPDDDATSIAVPAGELPVLAAGSWVYGNLATWIGARDKNRAWDLLCAAKTCYDEVLAGGRVAARARAQALAQLADCEASDWFWWPGEDNPGASVSAFEALFRRKLANLYRLLGQPAPPELSVAFSAGATGGGTAEIGGTMRRGSV